ncbi:MAG: signal peptidase II [Candidatus Gastranaerophilales bacterium]|nr:signal peptidase II [Candidatus Gastranaerophilales bacterium]
MVVFNFLITGYILNNVFVACDNLRFIDIVYVKNTGAAFSSFQHSTLLLIICSVIVMSVVLFELFRNRIKYSPVFYFFSAMLLSGIFCNTYERITLGYVRDFISLKFIKFPVFNISDILINFGVLAIMYLIVTGKYLRHD